MNRRFKIEFKKQKLKILAKSELKKKFKSNEKLKYFSKEDKSL